MHYVIYPDTLFLENLICNLLFLTFLKSLFFPSAKGKRILLASVVTAFCNTLISILFFRCIWILQVAGLFPAAGFMVWYCFEINDQRRMLFLLYQMILWILVMVGMIQIFNHVVLSVLLIVLVFGILEKVFKTYRQQNTWMRKVILYFGEACVEIGGFVDTGNHLTDPISKKPVSIITFEAWHKMLKGAEEPLLRVIPYKSVGNPHGYLWGVQIDSMEILDGNQRQIIEKPMIAMTEQPFTGIFHYSILLHSDYA